MQRVRLLDEVVVTTPTIGSNVEEIEYKNLKFYCWDIGGQNALRQSWSNYFADTHVRNYPLSLFLTQHLLTFLLFLCFKAIIYVVDSTDRDRLSVAKEELDKTLKHDVRSFYSEFIPLHCSQASIYILT